MKWLIMIFLASLSNPLFSQDSLLYGIFPMNGGKVLYEKVVTIDNISKDELYSRARNWALTHYRSQKDANQISDKESGILSYSGFVKVFFEIKQGLRAAAYWDCWQILTVQCKAGRAKVSIGQIEYRFPAVYSQYGNTPARAIQLEEMRQQLEGLKTGILGKSYKEKYWEAELETLRKTDEQMILLMTSVEKALQSAQADF